MLLGINKKIYINKFKICKVYSYLFHEILKLFKFSEYFYFFFLKYIYFLLRI